MPPTQITAETRGILFDMDGVLISSIGSVRRCWREWCRRYGVPNADTFEIAHGVRALDLIKGLRPDIDPQEGLRVIEDLELEDVADLKVLDGVADLLASLPKDRWAIVTSATRRLMLGRLAVAGLPAPDRIIAADDVVNGKPDPEPYRKGAELLGFPASECIVVEDAPAGASAGLGAGARVLAVLGTHAAEELSHATWIVNSLADVRAVVNGDHLTLTFQGTVAAGKTS